jgi:hypothetical protein
MYISKPCPVSIFLVTKIKSNLYSNDALIDLWGENKSFFHFARDELGVHVDMLPPLIWLFAPYLLSLQPPEGRLDVQRRHYQAIAAYCCMEMGVVPDNACVSNLIAPNGLHRFHTADLLVSLEVVHDEYTGIQQTNFISVINRK